MRKKFQLKDLCRGNLFYPSFYQEFYIVLHKYLQDNPEFKSQSDRLERGYSEWKYLLQNISCLNGGIITLLNKNESGAAIGLIRLQAINWLNLYAEIKFANNILYKIYCEGQSLEHIPVNGQYLTFSQLFEENPVMQKIWNEYQLTILQSTVSKENKVMNFYNYLDGTEPMPKCQILRFTKDILSINQQILNLLISFMKRLKS